jgi:16S rRNA G966 N2-methylase RsmD
MLGKKSKSITRIGGKTLTKLIKVTCKGSDTVRYDLLEPFQGDLKSLTENNFKKLKKMILELGFTEPISVWNDKGSIKILNGHQRLKTVTQMIEKEGYECPDLPVNWVDANSYDQAKRKVLALTSQYGKMETQGLYEFLSDTDIQPHDLGTDYHFPEINTDEFVDEYYKEISEDKSDVEDAVPEVRETDIKLGDIYQLGDHRLVCGDSTSKECVDLLMNGEKADMVYTDPPYGIAFKSGQKNSDKSTIGDRKYHNHKIIEGDHSDFDPSFILNQFSDVDEIFIWGVHNYPEKLPRSTWICWDRKLTEEMDKHLNGDFDLCWSKQRHKMVMLRITWSGVCGHSKTDDGATKVHPTQKPVKLAEAFFDRWGKGKTNIVDLFGGSGSTLITCEKTDRRCFMMEIDPHYCQVIIDRWEEYSGKKSVKLNDVKD